MTGRRLVALLVAVLLGVGGGVSTAVLGADDDAPAAYADPLGLRHPQVDLACTGEPVLVVGNGENGPPLSSAIANLSPAERAQVRYLDTRESCDAQWVAEDSPAEPRWVAYLGPGDRTELCTIRMRADHRGDNVTFLRSGSDERAECLCEVNLSDTAPELAPGMETDDATVVWVKALQSVLLTIDDYRRRPDSPRGPGATALSEDDVTGQYDARTIARVNSIHEASDRPATGVVDRVVWGQVVQTGCDLYDYD